MNVRSQVVVALSISFMLLASSGAYGQTNVCVYNQPASTYVAKMQVCTSGGTCTVWSSGFPKAQAECEQISSLGPAGTDVTAKVLAVAGRTVDCTPSFSIDPNFKGTATFHSSERHGTRAVGCDEPGRDQGPGAACVYLEPGAEFAARMQICPEDVSCDSAQCTAWSGDFTIGNTVCQSNTNITNGKVCVHAIGGDVVSCLPDYKLTPNPQLNYVYHTYGTTLQVGCRMLGE